MYKVRLVNMPFGSLNMPSIALTQLKSVVERELGDRVEVEIHYLSHEFAHYLSRELYDGLGSVQAGNAGAGEWFFRSVAFPDAPDNEKEYFQRYFPHRDPEMEARRQAIVAKRRGLERFLLRQIARHRLDKADLVGLTSMFSQNVANVALARLLKKKNPRLVTVLGGANCEAGMGRELARHLEPIDYVFSGPSLVSFPTLIGHLLAGEGELCQEIPGVLTSKNCDDERFKGPWQIGKDLPIEVPVPLDYEPFLENLEKSFPQGAVEPWLLFETSRGCWWGERSHCTFCGLNGGTLAYRSLPDEDALEMIQNLLDRYSDRCKRFESVDNIMPRSYLKNVFPQLKPPEGVSFFYEVKADLKEHEMDVLSEARVISIQPGIEALASSTLKLMGKGTTSFQNLAFLKGCVTYGIDPHWNLLIGFPGEGEEVYEGYLRAIPLLHHLPPPAGAFPVRFDRFSPYFTRADSYGLKLSPYDFYGFIYPFPQEALAQIAYFFEDLNYQSKYLAHTAEWQPKLNAAIEVWKKRWEAGGKLVMNRNNGNVVVRDTRYGEPREHKLEPLDVSILDALYTKGFNPSRIAAQVKGDESEVGEALERLGGQGLLFEENGRYSNLVIDERRRAQVRAARES